MICVNFNLPTVFISLFLVTKGDFKKLMNTVGKLMIISKYINHIDARPSTYLLWRFLRHTCCFDSWTFLPISISSPCKNHKLLGQNLLIRTDCNESHKLFLCLELGTFESWIYDDCSKECWSPNKSVPRSSRTFLFIVLFSRFLCNYLSNDK